MDSNFRQLNIRERELLEKLLEGAIEGRDELRIQMSSLTVKQIEKDGTLSLRCEFGPPSPGKYAPVAEGWCKDADGMTISVLLHVGKDGYMHMLEIMRLDGADIVVPPSARDMLVLLPESGGKKPGF
ncbi:MAG TPA: hypothetical protein VNU94_06270 [Acidobacteriaceae bacterium]|nr:hypothetical protein [Acidobacteriaceae bacterium]